jgi:hypothetical protein
MRSRANSPDALSAAPTSSPGMNLRTARRANERRRNWSANQALREARSNIDRMIAIS